MMEVTPEERITKAYEKILSNLREILDTTGELSKTEFDRALKTAGTSLEGASKFTQEEIEKARQAIRKDWQALMEIANEQKDVFIKSEQFQRFTDTSLGVLGKVAKSVKDWASFVDEQVETQLTYHTGEITGTGMLQCTNCKKTLTLKRSGRIPPCSSCKGTTFRRTF